MNENNQNFFQKNAGALVLIVLAGIGFWIYSAFFKIAPQNTTQPITAVGQQVIVTLRRLENVSLDGSLFATSEFQGLTEFQLVIPSQPVGRPNPFVSFR